MENEIINKFNNSVNKESNSELLNLNTEIIRKTKHNILKELSLSRDELKILHSKLENYRFIDECHELKYGTYIRYIKLTDPTNIKLMNGGLICDISIINDAILIKCKNNMNKFFSIKMNECLIFQKITEEERLLLIVLDYIK
jgi:hypothetical protein